MLSPGISYRWPSSGLYVLFVSFVRCSRRGARAYPLAFCGIVALRSHISRSARLGKMVIEKKLSIFIFSFFFTDIELITQSEQFRCRFKRTRWSRVLLLVPRFRREKMSLPCNYYSRLETAGENRAACRHLFIMLVRSRVVTRLARYVRCVRARRLEIHSVYTKFRKSDQRGSGPTARVTVDTPRSAGSRLYRYTACNYDRI